MDWSRIIYEIETKTPLSGSLATNLGVRYQYLSDLRSGKTKMPNAEFVLALIMKLNINPEWLSGESKEMFIQKKYIDEPISIDDCIRKIITSEFQTDTAPQFSEHKELITAQEKRIQELESKQSQMLKEMYELMEIVYSEENLKKTKPYKAIERGMDSKGRIHERTIILSPDGTEQKEEGASSEYRIHGGAESETHQSAPAYGSDEDEATERLPLALNLAAGIPREACDSGDTVAVPSRFLKKGHNYCVAKIAGTSMTEAGIQDGSHVLLEYSNEPKAGAIMVVKYGANTTLKLLHLTEGGTWELRYQDGSGAKVELKDYEWEVQGLFVRVLKP